MKRFLPWLILLLAIAALAWTGRPAQVPPGEFDLGTLGKIPVQENGRVKPMDTVARNALLILHGRQSLRLENGRTLSAMQWLADVLFHAPEADRYPLFRIRNPEVLGLFGWEQGGCFGYGELAPFLPKIAAEASRAEALEPSRRSLYQKAIFDLREALGFYQHLKNGDAFQPIPPGEPGTMRHGDWVSLKANGAAHPVSETYSALADAYRAGERAGGNRQIAQLAATMAALDPDLARRTAFEAALNRIAPFYQSLVLYLLAFLLACASWLVPPARWTRRSAFFLLLLGLALHTFGIAARMVLQGRPPVTNLYSSAVFVGWGAVLFGAIVERKWRDGMALSAATLTGFATLIIAHHLACGGDTMEMMRAVLDTNFWLATHVVTITLGYSAMFLAGILAAFYVLRGVFTRSLTREAANSLERMTYGVVCFATLFSLAGTVLGGIWADQSWGRFWGWDPKENGALLIVLWCAILLHARLGGQIGQRGLMMLAIFGNVITSFSWFGVNMLGVGLHSYGFMDTAYPWLVAFAASQLALMAIAAIPMRHWPSNPIENRSLREQGKPLEVMAAKNARNDGF